MLTKSDLSNIRSIVKEEIGNETSPIKKDLSLVKKDIKRIDRKFDKLFNFLDEQYLKVKRDVREIQAHLKMPVSEF